MVKVPIVGEAIIRVRVTSDRLAADIRDAVKNAVRASSGDLDSEGEKAGERLNQGVARGVRKSAPDVGKEFRQEASRFAADSNGVIDDQGDRLGRRFTTAVSRGVRNGMPDVGKELAVSVQRSLGPAGGGSGFDRLGNDAGTRFVRAINSGIGDGQPELQRQLEAPFRRLQLTSGSRGALQRVGHNVIDAIDDGVRDAGPDFENTFRRTAKNATDNTEKDWRDNFRRIFVSGIRGATPDISVEYGKLLRNSLRDGARNAVRDTSDDFGNAARRAQNNFRNTLGAHLLAFRGVGRDWASSTVRGFTDGDAFDRAGEDAATDTDRGLRRGVNRNRGGWTKLITGIGTSIGKNFNLGIGAARMGEGVISILTTAGPSIIAAGGAIFTSLAAEIVTLMSAIGPGIAGAAGVGIAAISTLGLNFGLLTLAMKKAFATVDGAKIKDTFKEIGNIVGTPVANGLLEGMLASVNRLKDALPQLTELLHRTGQAYGQIIERVLDTVSSQANMSRIGKILETNIGFLDSFRDGIGGLTESFLILFAASKPFIDYIGTGIKRFGEWAAASLSVSEANGNLSAWMDGMLASFKDLLGIVKNFSSGIGNIFSAAAPAGETLLSSIRGIAERFNAWTSDTGNMARMEGFFTKAHILASKVFDVLGSIFTAGGKAFENMNLDPLLHVLDTLQNVVAPAIARFFNQIQTGASANLVAAFDNIGTALTKIADSGSFEKVANLISTIILKISEFAASDFGSSILGIVLPLAVMGGILTSLLGPVFSLVSGLGSLAGAAFGVEGGFAAAAAGAAPFVAVAAAIAGAFVLVYTQSEKFRESIGGLLSAMGGAFSSVWENLAPKVELLWSKLTELAAVIGDRLAPIIDFIGPVIARAISFIGDSLGNAMTILGGFIDVLIGVFTLDWEKVWEGIKEIFSGIWDQIVNIFETAKSALSFAWDAITAVVYNGGQVLSKFFGSIWDAISRIFMTAVSAIGSWFADRWGNIVNVFMGVWNNVTSFISTVWDGIWSVISGAVGIILSGLKVFGNLILQIILAPFRLAWLILEPIWNGIASTLATIWEGIQAVASTVWGAISDFFSGIWDSVTTEFSAAWTQLTGNLSTWWTNIQTVATTVWTAITDFFSGIWDAVTTEFSTAWTQLTTNLSVWWTNIQTTASTIWTAISDFFVNIWNTIVTVFHAAVDPIVTWLGEQWTNISNTVSNAWNAIVAFFTGIWNSITGQFHGAVDPLVSWLSDRWTSISNTASNIWNGIVGTASRIWNDIVTAVTNVVGPLVGTLQGYWDDITIAVSAAWNGLAGTVRGIWDAISTSIWQPILEAYNQVTAWVGAIVGALQAAWNTISGIAEDIKNAFAAATTAAADAATLAPINLGGPVNSLLGPTMNMIRDALTNQATPFALGGIVSQPTLALIGERGRERVEPLAADGLSLRDRAMIKAIVASLTGTGSSGNIQNIQIGNETLVTLVDGRIAKQETNFARRMRNARPL